MKAHSHVAAVLLSIASLFASGSSSLAQTQDDGERRDLLRKLERVAALYRDKALQFTCDEKIVVTWNSGGRLSRKYRYVYVRDEAGQLLDYRTPRRGERAESGEQVDMETAGLPSYVLRAYSSVFLFDEESQDCYRYEILEREHALGRPAIKIGLEPTSSETCDPDEWHGAAWVDSESYQLLRFEGIQHQDYERKMEFERHVARHVEQSGNPPRSVAVQQVSAEFGVKKNGMRFPSRVTIVASRLYPPHNPDGPSRQAELLWVTQKYTGYQFYGVHTWERVWEFVLAGEESREKDAGTRRP